MSDLIQYLEHAVSAGASDLFFVAGGPVSVKLEGHIRPVNEKRLLPPDTKELILQIYALAQRPMDQYEQTGDDDFSFAVSGLARFRVNAYKQRSSLAAVVRIVSFDIPKWEEINILPQVMDLADTPHGLILFTGTAGSGILCKKHRRCDHEHQADTGRTAQRPACGEESEAGSSGRADGSVQIGTVEV